VPAPVGRLERDDAMVVVGLYYLAKANMFPVLYGTP